MKFEKLDRTSLKNIYGGAADDVTCSTTCSDGTTINYLHDCVLDSH